MGERARAGIATAAYGEGGVMVEPLTDYERKVWKESAEDILAHPETYRDENRPGWIVFARNRLRYEQTIQDVEAQLEDLALAVLNTVAYDEPLQGIHKLARAATGDGEVTPYRDIIQAKDAQIERLANAILDVETVGASTDEGDACLVTALGLARAAIKEATS